MKQKLFEDWRKFIRNRDSDEDRPCLTPGSMFHIYIGNKKVSVGVDLPMDLPNLSEEEMQELEDQMHDALEAILARFFEK